MAIQCGLLQRRAGHPARRRCLDGVLACCAFVLATAGFGSSSVAKVWTRVPIVTEADQGMQRVKHAAKPLIREPSRSHEAARGRSPIGGKAASLPRPYFAALRSDRANMRVGPGLRYPIKWIYKREDLPVEIVRRFGVWRLVRDPEGTQGWMHQALLIGHRTFITIGAAHMLRRRSDAHAAPVALLRAGVIGRLHFCEATSAWCKVDTHGYHGWLPRTAFWGAFPGEELNE